MTSIDEAFTLAQAKCNKIYDRLDECVINALGERPTRIDGISAWVAAVTLAGYLEGWLIYHKAMSAQRLGLDQVNALYSEGLNHGFMDALRQETEGAESEGEDREYDPGPEIDDEGGMSEYRDMGWHGDSE